MRSTGSQDKCKLNSITPIIQAVGGAALFLLSFAVLHVPYKVYFIGGSLFIVLVACGIACHWWTIGARRPTSLNIVNICLVWLAAFLIGGLGLIWQHGLFKNIETKIIDFRAVPNLIAPGDCTMLKVDCRDIEDDTLHFQYDAEAGEVFRGRWQLPEIQYCSPNDKDGNIKVSVTVFDAVERSSYPSSDAFVTVAWNGTKARLFFEEGLMALKREEYDKAITNFDKTIDTVPHFADAYLARGLAEVNLGKWDIAVGDFSANITLPRGDASAYLWRASRYEQLGLTKLAKDDLQDFLKESRNIDPEMSRGLLQEYETSSKDERLEILNEAIKKSPNPFPHVWEEQTLLLPPL